MRHRKRRRSRRTTWLTAHKTRGQHTRHETSQELAEAFIHRLKLHSHVNMLQFIRRQLNITPKMTKDPKSFIMCIPLIDAKLAGDNAPFKQWLPKKHDLQLLKMVSTHGFEIVDAMLE